MALNVNTVHIAKKPRPREFLAARRVQPPLSTPPEIARFLGMTTRGHG